jgi:hypothetical protein
VTPDETVSTLRPPGMKRAVMSSNPPRWRIWVSAHSRRATRLGFLAAQRSIVVLR